MGKKSVLIADHITLKRKGHKTTENGIDASHAASSSRTISIEIRSKR